MATKASIRFLVFFTLGLLLVAPFFVLAQEPPGGLPPAGEVGVQGAAAVPAQAGLVLPSTDPRLIAAKVIRVALSFLGVVVLGLILYGGYLWMTSAGNEETIAKAKKVLTNAVIGLTIILLALAITQFIINALLKGQAVPPLPASPAPPRVGGGALGSGIIESHYPMRGAVNVPRNTRIIITFKEKIDPASLAELLPEAPAGTPLVTQSPEGAYLYPTILVDFDSDPATPALPISALRLKRNSDGTPSAIQIIKTADISGSIRGSDGDKYMGSESSGVDVLVTFTQDLRTFVFTPVERAQRSRRALFGSATENTPYSVYLCGTASSAGNCAPGGIKLLGGQSAFAGAFKDYQWPFEVGTFLDVTPPKIQSVIPHPEAADRPRNSLVQVNFNEAVLPTVASGKNLIAYGGGGPQPTQGPELAPGAYQAMRVRLAAGNFIAGEWQIGNQYRTSEFTSTDLCGRNSCGEDVFCLPSTSRLSGEILAATLAQAGEPASAGRFDGLEDVAGNSLDGNRNGVAQGPGNQGAATWFDLKNLAAPVQPNDPGDNARFFFSTSDTILLGAPQIELTRPVTSLGAATPGAALVSPVEMIYDRAIAMTTLSSRNILLSGTDAVTGGAWDTWWTLEGENLAEDPAYPYGHTAGRILHGGLWEQTNYLNEVTSRVRDLFQNCYYPGGGRVPGGTCTADSLSYPKVYCCDGAACAPGDVNCQRCGF